VPTSSGPGRATTAALKPALDELYAAFNRPESALDPVQVVHRYRDSRDREVVAFIAAALAFGRVTSVVQSIEAVLAVLGPQPAQFIRGFDPTRDGRPLRGLVHRWTRGRDFVALIWILRQWIERDGSIEAAAGGLMPDEHSVGPLLERLSTSARGIDLRPVYGRVRPTAPGVYFFFSRPSTGSACKRLNLFLRWMVRCDQVDPGGWTSIEPRHLIVPLDTHTIRIGRCLRLTRRASPGWKMAVDITDALRVLDPIDPVRYDFALCHLSMMGACGRGSPQGDSQCPLRGLCHPGHRPKR